MRKNLSSPFSSVLCRSPRQLLAYLFIAGLLAGFQAHGQAVQNAFNLTYIPPSPSAAALGKFGSFPVSLNTGVPSISVPFFSYRGLNNGLSLNVGLSYHAGGIRVEEVAGNTGMGWALDAGGVITRTSRSLPDDLPLYGYLTLFPLPVPTNGGSGHNATTDAAAKAYVNNSYDGEQDEFNFNFNGHSGKFILDGKGNPLLVTKEALKITPIKASGAIFIPYAGFVITDQSGIKYVFQDKENTTANLSTVLSPVTYASSYYLSYVINPSTRDTIKFHYNTAHNTLFNLGSESCSNLYSGTNLAANVYTTPTGTTTSILVKRIKSINLPNNTEIDFYYNPLSRCDLKGDSTLAEVRQRNTASGAYTSYKLYESYIYASGIKQSYAPAPCDLTDGNNVRNIRLRLDSVKQVTAGDSLKPHVFAYDDSHFLPATDSYEQDFWGFYNGALNLTGHLVPKMLYKDGTGTYMLDGADRRVDSLAVSAGALTRVTYPTGGYTQLDYEANRAGNGKLIFNYTQNNTVVFDANEDPVQPFTINNQPNNQRIDYKFRLISWCPSTATSCSYVFKITNTAGTVTYATETFSHSEVGTTKTITLTLPNGSYHLTWGFTSPGSCTCDDNFGFNLSYMSATADSSQMGSGIRIKRMTSYDGVSHANDQVKQYRYVNADGTSSGYAAVLPAYAHSYQDCTYVPGTPQTDPSSYRSLYVVRTANSNLPLTYQGQGINYARLEVTDVGTASNGKEVSYFTSFKDAPPIVNSGGIFTFPFAPLQTLDWRLGLNTRHEVYDGAGRLLKKTLNAYTEIPVELEDTLINYKVGTPYVNNCGSPIGDNTEYLPTTYFWTRGRTDLGSVLNVDYTAAGDSTVTTTSYTYNPSYFLPARELTVNSRGDSIATYHYYPYDYSIAGSVYTAMRDSNIIAKPVSNELWKYLNGAYYLTSADATDYGLYNGLYQPSKYYYLQAAAPVATATIGAFDPSKLLRMPALYAGKINFSSYDGKGNPVLINQLGLRTGYIWDINREFPVAKVSNADSLAFAYTSFEADGSGNFTIPSALRDATTAITGKRSYQLGNGAISFTGLTATRTYTVSYWSRNGSYAVTGSTQLTTGGTVNGWTFYQHKVTGISTLQVSGTGNIDELRLYPSNAQMTTYTYDPVAGITSAADAKEEITYYEYDPFLRLMNVKDKDGNITRSYNYHYQGQ